MIKTGIDNLVFRQHIRENFLPQFKEQLLMQWGHSISLELNSGKTGFRKSSNEILCTRCSHVEKLRLNGLYSNNMSKNKKLQQFFVIGKKENQPFSQEVLDEMAKYDDIVVGDFVDSYLNLTMKTFIGLVYIKLFR